MSYAIAIDGPSGAGKSTIAKRVAKELSTVPWHCMCWNRILIRRIRQK